MNRVVVFAALIAGAGCSRMTFRADNPRKEYPRKVSVASRLARANASCDTIGTLLFDDGRVIDDSDIENIADTVAKVGGTHYVIRDRTTKTRRGKDKPTSGVVEVLICTSGVKSDDD